MMGVLCQQKKPLPRILFLFTIDYEGFKNSGSLGNTISVGQSSVSGSSSINSGRLYTKRNIWTLGDTQLLAFANEAFEFGADIQIVADETFPFLSKTNAMNGGSRGWEIGFLDNQVPYYKDLASGTVVLLNSAAPLNTVFAFKVVSDGLHHEFFINGVSVGSVSYSTANIQAADLLYMTNHYFFSELYIDNFYFK